MPRVELVAFGGVRPSLSRRLVKAPMGDVSHNVDGATGYLTPLKLPKIVQKGRRGNTIHVREDMGYVWGTRTPDVYVGDVSVVPMSSPVTDGAIGHVMFCNVQPETLDHPQSEQSPIQLPRGPHGGAGESTYPDTPPWDPQQATRESRAATACPLEPLAVERDGPVFSGEVPPECTSRPIFIGEDADDGDAAETLSVYADPPTVAPVVTVQPQTPSGEVADCPDQQTFVLTYLSDLGLETAPSPHATAPFVQNAATVIDVALPSPPQGANIVRVYRTGLALGSSADGRRGMELPGFFLVGEWLASTISVRLTGDISTDLGDRLETYEVRPPPAMEQVVMSDTGFYVGFRNNVLHVSERHEIANWPMKFEHTLDDRIIGLVATGTSVYVFTTGKPYLVSFALPNPSNDPDYGSDSGVSVTAYTRDIRAYSKRAMCATPYGALVASHEGVFILSGPDAKLISNEMVSRPQWDEYLPDVLAYSSGFIYGAGGTHSWRMQAPFEGRQQIAGDFITLDLAEPGQVVHDMAPSTDGHLWILNGNLELFAESDVDAVARWRSPVVHTASRLAWRFAKIESDFAAPLIFRLYRGSAMVFERRVSSEAPFTLPPCGRGFKYRVEIETSGTVGAVVLGTSKTDLATFRQ